MTIASLEVAFFTAIFILPGFIITNIIDSINPPKKNSDHFYFLKCFAYSIVNCACWSWIYNILFNIKEQSLMWLLLVASSIIGAVIIALVISWLKQTKKIDSVLAKMNIKKIHAIPSAWDYYFSMNRRSFLIITLIDGSILRGWYSSNSFSSSDPEERDLYIEQCYRINENNEWQIDTESEGCYVSMKQIKFIEFKKGTKNE